VYKIAAKNETVAKQNSLLMKIYNTNNEKISKTAKIYNIEGNSYPLTKFHVHITTNTMRDLKIFIIIAFQVKKLL
jgi:carbonic anhydrase